MSRMTTNVSRRCECETCGVSGRSAVQDSDDIHPEQPTDNADERRCCCPCITAALPPPKSLSTRRPANYDAAAQGLSSHLMIVRKSGPQDLPPVPPNPPKTLLRRREATGHAAQDAVAEHLSTILKQKCSRDKPCQAGCCPCEDAGVVGVAGAECCCTQEVISCCGCNEEVRARRDAPLLGPRGPEGTDPGASEEPSEDTHAPAN